MPASTGPIGIIGLGLLGSAIAERLLFHGETLCGYDLNDQQRQTFQSQGGLAVEQPETIFTDCQLVILSLPTSEIVRELVECHTKSMRASQLVVDTTTGEPAQMVEIGKKLAQHGVEYIEATVGGSSVQVAAGDATVFVGRSPESKTHGLADVVLAQIFKKVFQLGEVGSASRFKLVHNLVLGLNRAALAEGLYFAEALELDPSMVLSILPQTAAASATIETKGAKMISKDFTPQAKLSQHLKDVRIMEQQATAVGASLPLTARHRELLELAEQLGLSDADNSAIIESIRQLSRNARVNKFTH